MDTNERWPALRKDDEGLMEELMQLLADRTVGSAYSTDGSFAAELAQLPPGLRAMAATHWLDVSLAMDSITCHFGNFGEIGLVRATEAGLEELGLPELAQCFREAKDLVLPLLAQQEGSGDLDDTLEQAGLKEQSDELDERAWALNDTRGGDSAIYKAWLRLARSHPERVFVAED